MTIRKVKESDNQVLAVIIRNTFDEHNAPKSGTVFSDPTTDNLYALFQNKKSVLWVAEEEENIFGCCGIYPTDGLPQYCAELVKFYLSPEARGKGIGRLLIEKSIDSAVELGYTDLYLESLPQFSNAIRMYEKMGFTALNAPLGTSGHISCNIWMIKRLCQ